MDNKPSRPLSVVITQLLLLLATLPFGYLILFRLFFVIDDLQRFGVMSTLATLLIAGVLLGLFLIAEWGLIKRKPYGRWLGLSLLSLLFITSVLGAIFRPRGPLEYYEYKNSSEASGGAIASITIYGLFLWLILHLAFAKRVTEFFSPVASNSINLPPPPPTSFD